MFSLGENIIFYLLLKKASLLSVYQKKENMKSFEPKLLSRSPSAVIGLILLVLSHYL